MAKRERLEDLGVILEKLHHLMDMDIFDDLSKHCPYWGEVDPRDLETKYGIVTKEEVLADRLDSCRMKFNCIHDAICECWTIARGDDDDL